MSAMKNKKPLNIPEELVLMLLNEQTGYFYQVDGWPLNCTIIGAILADLSLKSRIDTDEKSLFLIDSSKTGEPILDLCLDEIASSPDSQTAHYWVEKLAIHSETIIDMTLKRLVGLNFLTHHEGEFYSINYQKNKDDFAVNQIKSNLREVIFNGTIPDPKDCLLIGLLNSCDIIRFIFELDSEAKERIDSICKMDLINRALSSSVKHAIDAPTSLRSTPLSKKIPQISFTKLLFNEHFWRGNIPALFAGIAEQYGPIFQVKSPFMKPLLFLAGAKINKWMHRNGRMYLNSGSYFRELEQACGAQGLISSLDGADHFRMRKVMKNIYSAEKFRERLDDMFYLARRFMSSEKWQAGSELNVKRSTRLMINLQMTRIVVSTDSQDIFEDLAKWKERASVCYVGHLLPKFLANTPSMKNRFRLLTTFMQRIQQNHTPLQRSEATRELADELISLHKIDPQILPEQNLPFMLAAAPILQSIYLGDLLGFALFEMSKNPQIAARIRNEANAIFDGEDPGNEEFSLDNCDVTHRFLMECLRMYPIVPMQVRNVSNSCVVENFSLPLGERVHVIQTASHYMSDSFPNPYKFDIDRYLPSRREHHSQAYAPYGLGTHMCVGYSWMNLQIVVNLLMLAYYFEFEPPPESYKLNISPFPTLSVSEKLKVRIRNQLRDLPALMPSA